MSTKSQYNFPESKLGPNFAQEKLDGFKRLIEGGQSFTVVSMPGVGVSYFLKYLTSKSKVLRASSILSQTASEAGPYFIYIDLYNLPTLSQHEFYRMFHRDLGFKPSSATDEQIFLEIKAKIKKLAEENEKVVVIFSRFDQLKKDLDKNFLSNLQSLASLLPGKIVLIFTAIKPLYELVPEACSGGNLPFYSRILYFKPYSNSDLKKLFLLDHTLQAHPELDNEIVQSGGHIQLLHVFINSHKKTNLLLDKFVRLQLKDLVDYLDYQQRKQVQKITRATSHPERAKRVEGSIDEYLLGVGYILETKSGYRLFSPVLEQYIRTNLPVRLPLKESKLFKLLRNNLGRVVLKDEIFQTVWGEKDEGATDWALDALIYRLRKHPFITSQGFIIESHKKVGYTMIQT